MTSQQDTKLTLAQIVGNLSTWKSKFAWQPVMSSGSTVHANVGSAPVEADSKKFVNQIASMTCQMEQMQQQVRGSRDNRTRDVRSQVADRGSGKGKGDNNKGGRSVERSDYRQGQGKGKDGKKQRRGPRYDRDHRRTPAEGQSGNAWVAHESMRTSLLNRSSYRYQHARRLPHACWHHTVL